MVIGKHKDRESVLIKISLATPFLLNKYIKVEKNEADENKGEVAEWG